MGAPAFLPCGDRAILVELSDAATVADYAASVRAAALPGIVDVVAAARTVLVVVEPELLSLAALRSALSAHGVEQSAGPSSDGPLVTIDVRYDGADLSMIAERTGLRADEVVRRHAAPLYRSAFCGFAPGFAYLTGLDPMLQLPRRETPRARVPRGSVAVAAEYCGIYPADMPGGWHLIGSTDAVLFDLGRTEPALLAAGTNVCFRPV